MHACKKQQLFYWYSVKYHTRGKILYSHCGLSSILPISSSVSLSRGKKRLVPPNLFHLESQRLSWESNADTVTTRAKAAAPLWSPQSCGNGMPCSSVTVDTTNTDWDEKRCDSQSVSHLQFWWKIQILQPSVDEFCLLSLFCFTSRQRDMQTMRFTPCILHCLPVHFRMAFTILSSVFKPLNGPVPGYCVGTLESLCIALSKTRPKIRGRCTPIKAFCKMLYIETAYVLIFMKWFKKILLTEQSSFWI